LTRHVVVFDAADIDAESRFWAAMLDGRVVDDDPRFHCVIDSEGNWVIGVQLAPDHTPPDWPDGAAQQVHIDLHAEDPPAAIDQATALGARLLDTVGEFDDVEGHYVFADPAGHPFCIGWGHPDAAGLARFLATLDRR
jgi:catechol 2,3-dioxygenase-like lactoylglutathione lyase family enzyme